MYSEHICPTSDHDPLPVGSIKSAFFTSLQAFTLNTEHPNFNSKNINALPRLYKSLPFKEGSNYPFDWAYPKDI